MNMFNPEVLDAIRLALNSLEKRKAELQGRIETSNSELRTIEEKLIELRNYIEKYSMVSMKVESSNVQEAEVSKRTRNVNASDEVLDLLREAGEPLSQIDIRQAYFQKFNREISPSTVSRMSLGAGRHPYEMLRRTEDGKITLA